ncbi:MAG: hypothetical protein AAF355_06685 [Myxococcota bacterium]
MTGFLLLSACVDLKPGSDTQQAQFPWNEKSACEVDPADRELVLVTEGIAQDTRWDCSRHYLLNGLIYVRSGAVLTIDPGTFVLGLRADDARNDDLSGFSGLIVERGARIVADGTETDPIVFTSAGGRDGRTTGDWAGVVLMGNAPINAGTSVFFEGLPQEAANAFGGADPTHDCGTLRYVRIEFAGARLAADREINGLSLSGCGSGTEVDYVQVHFGRDDGLEIFGGTVDVRHIVISRAQDDSLDWDMGWRGRAQFVVIQQDDGDTNDGIEADNLEGVPDALPRSEPLLYNVTLIGNNDAQADQTGVVLRRGTYGVIRNAIIAGFPHAAIDVRGSEAAAGATLEEPRLAVENSFFFDIGGPGGQAYFELEAGESDDDGGFAEDDFFSDEARQNRFGASVDLLDPYNLLSPDFTLRETSDAQSSGSVPPDDGFFDTSAIFSGAMATEDWTANWTAYPSR